jgi:hypothetical protein
MMSRGALTKRSFFLSPFVKIKIKMSNKRVKEKNFNNNILSPSHQLATETNINLFATAGCMFLRALCVSTKSEREKIWILSSMDPKP